MPAQILHLLRIGQDHFQLAIVQNVENRFPIRSRALHHHMRTFVLMQPHPQLLQSLSEHAELAYFQRRCGLGISTHYANHYKLSPYVNTGTTFDHGWNHLLNSFLSSLLAMYGRKVYWFKLLYELALNSGCDYLTPGPVHYREDTSPHHYAERPFSPRRLYSLTPARTRSSVFMIEGGRPCRPCVVHRRPSAAQSADVTSPHARTRS